MEIPEGTGLASYFFDLDNDAGDLVVTCGHSHAVNNEAGAVDFANDLQAAWVAEILPIQSSDLTFTKVSVLARAAGAGIMYSAESTGAAAVGGAAFGALPGMMAVVVKKLTGRAGRKYRGRMFVPGLASDNDVPNSTLLTEGRKVEVDAAFEDWRTTLEALAHDALLLHTDPLVPPDLIVSFSASRPIGALRRRRDRA